MDENKRNPYVPFHTFGSATIFIVDRSPGVNENGAQRGNFWLDTKHMELWVCLVDECENQNWAIVAVGE